MLTQKGGGVPYFRANALNIAQVLLSFPLAGHLDSWTYMNVGDEDYYYIDDDDDGVGASWRRLCQCSPIDPLDFAILDRGHQHLWQTSEYQTTK